MLSFSLVVSVSASEAMWSQTYGGAGYERVLSLVETSDGGYVLAGETDSFDAGNSDLWLVKTDVSGNMQWSKRYGGTNSDRASSVVETSDGGLIIAGDTRSFGAGDEDFWLIKTDAYGSMTWNKTYGGIGDDAVWSVVQTADGGYILAGYTTSFGAGGRDFWLVKTDPVGNMEWNKTYGGPNEESAWSFVVSPDGGYALAGYKSSSVPGNDDFWLVKTDLFGNMEWNKTYGGAEEEQAFSLIVTSDGGYALAGTVRALTGSGGAPNATSGDFWLVKVDASGNMEWNKTIGGPRYEWLCSLIQTSDYGYALAGSTKSFGAGDEDIWLVKTDNHGNIEWNQTHGGAESDRAWALIQTSDNRYALAGHTKSFCAGIGDFWLVKTGASAPANQFKMNFGESPTNVVLWSNSTLKNYNVDYVTKQISFIVTGSTGTIGVCNITIPEDLLWDNFSVYLGEKLLVAEIDYTITYTGSHYIVSITYHHSSHTITVTGTSPIPEFSTGLLTLLLTVTLFIVYAKKKLEQKPQVNLPS